MSEYEGWIATLVLGVMIGFLLRRIVHNLRLLRRLQRGDPIERP